MKLRLFSFAVVASSLLISSISMAHIDEIQGYAAVAFIAEHFPDAALPGHVEGYVTYIDHWKKEGYAKCYYPAMGGRSDGAIPTCEIEY